MTTPPPIRLGVVGAATMLVNGRPNPEVVLTPGAPELVNFDRSYCVRVRTSCKATCPMQSSISKARSPSTRRKRAYGTSSGSCAPTRE